MTYRDLTHFSGCLLGGAIGDALGAPVEFLSLAQIRRRFGEDGLRDYVHDADDAHGLAEFTDDTQMTLFTAEGLVIARRRNASTSPESIFRSYLRWLRTQRTRPSGPTGELTREGWLLGIQAMWKIRAPGGTCLSALESGRMGRPDAPINNSKGCGGVMRVAPLGLVFADEAAFNMGVTAAAITHGHPSGYLSAGVFAQVIAETLAGRGLEDAIQHSLTTLARWPEHAETMRAVENAVEAARSLPHTPETVETLGGGWVAEEALAITLFCALAHADDFAKGVLLAVNHSGDSDSTGSMTGSLLGLRLGKEAIPAPWVEGVELRAVIEEMAEALLE